MTPDTPVRSPRTSRLLRGCLFVMLLGASVAHAQIGTATLKGQILAGESPTPAGTEVVATNADTGVSHRTATREDGSYVLTGLAPGSYRITIAGSQQAEAIELRVGQTASLDFSVATSASPTQLGAVTVVGSVLRQDVKTSEIGTTISPIQIESLPQTSRNILSFADLAPGVRFNVAQNTGHVRVQSGAQNQDNVNLFIDGVSQKNFVLRGGIAGMDATRGNPFPQSAIREYRVITQNYKAEYDQVSSAAITAVTRSGTNEFEGGVFYDRVEDSWVSKSPFEKRAEAAGVERPSFDQSQYGLTIGGPIALDRAHFFLAYEGKDITQPRQVVLQNANLLPAGGIVPSLQALEGSSSAEFDEHLFLGKIDLEIGDSQHMDFTVRIREESDFVPEDTLLSAPGNDKDRTNDETRLDLRHSVTFGDWLNEARVGYQDTVWNPHARQSVPMIRYFVSPTNQTNNVVPVLIVGGSPDAQERNQSGYLVQNDLTFTGVTGHTFKGGVKVNFLDFDLSGTAFAVPVERQLIDNTTGDTTTFQVDNAVPAAAVGISNTIVGIYFQDDWEVNERLELNLGIRWDYETNMLNDDYVTPADRVTALLGPDGPRWGITPPPGQTYAQSLALGGVIIENFIADGRSREDYKGAFQPRFGFSYDFSGGEKTTVLFGGAGRAYDRTMANNALDELQKNMQPGGEIWLIRNDHEMPYTDQYTLGVRQALGAWNGELGVFRSDSKNQFNWYGGNRDANGGWATQSPIDPLWGGPVGYGTLILGDFVTKARTDSAYLRADKPFTRDSGWGVAATYTYSDGQTTNRQWTNDIFNWTYGKPGQSGFNPSVDVEEHRFVGTFITDRVPLGLMFSAKAVWGSGFPYQVTSCAAGWNLCVYEEGDGESYSQVDIALSKSFEVGRISMTFRADVLNVFDTVNYSGYDGWGGGPGNPQNQYGGDNPNVGIPNSIFGPMRTIKLSFSSSF